MSVPKPIIVQKCDNCAEMFVVHCNGDANLTHCTCVTAAPLSSATLGKCLCSKQHNLVPANGQWCLPAASGVALAMHHRHSGSPLTGSRPRRGGWAPPRCLVEHGWLYLYIVLLQPENLLVDTCTSQAAPLLKLVDFGDACHIYDDSYVHRLRGSAEFAAPELITGRPASLLSDIWYASLLSQWDLCLLETDVYSFSALTL